MYYLDTLKVVISGFSIKLAIIIFRVDVLHHKIYDVLLNVFEHQKVYERLTVLYVLWMKVKSADAI